jgi:hypothetical protein
MRMDEERDPCSKADELLLHRLLTRHGVDPDRRPHVCELAGVLVGGHELDSSETCGRCSQRVPGSSRSGRGRDRGGMKSAIEPAGRATYDNFEVVHVPRADRDRDRPARSARLAVPGAIAEQLTSKAASSPHGCPGPSTPTANARATRARSARPATVTLSRISSPAISSPALPGRPPPEKSPGPAGRVYGNARSTQRLTSSRNTRLAWPVRARPWKADGAHRPSWRPDAVRYMSVDTATGRSTAPQGDT